MSVRIRIREQLCLLIAVIAMMALLVLAVSVWIQSRHFMLLTRAQTLQVTASLKADQLAQDLSLFSDSVVSITTRDKLQGFLKDFNSGNTTNELRDDLAVSVLQEVRLEFPN